jgi:hypothetical protein
MFYKKKNISLIGFISLIGLISLISLIGLISVASGQDQDMSGGTETSGKTNITVSCDKYGYPWCGGEAKDPAGFVGSFYKIALGLAGAAALGVLIYGAILWTLSGAVTSKQDAKEWISGALWGLVLLLGAYLILYTINPRLVKIGETQKALEEGMELSEEVKAKLKEAREARERKAREARKDSWQAFSAKDVKPLPDLFKTLDPKIYSSDSLKRAEQEAANLNCLEECVSISTPRGGYYLPNIKEGICQGHVCSVSKDLASKLGKFYEKRPPNTWVITEAWPPDVRHQNICHYKGECIDANFKDRNPNERKIKSFIEDAKSVGLKAIYEVKTQAEKDVWVRKGVPESYISVVPKINAPHFSIYNK